MIPRNRRRRSCFRRLDSVLVASETLESRALLAATVQVFSNINVTNPFASVREVTSVGSDLYFVASEANSSNLDLWKSNGTTAGTIRLAGLGPADTQSRQLTNVNGTLYFRGYNAGEGHELWKSNGTVAGTAMVRSLTPGLASSTLTDLKNFNGSLFFSGNGDFYKTNGTSTGTVRVTDLVVGASDEVAELETVGSSLFFRAKNAAGGSDLYQTNGTRAGTVRMASVPAGTLTNFTKVGNGLFFFRNDRELWKTSADLSTAARVVELGTTFKSTEQVDVSGTLYFNHSNSGYILKSDGTAEGTVGIADTGGIYSYPARTLAAWTGALYFSAGSRADDGQELWRSDGTTAGTILLKDINPHFNEGYGYGSYPKSFTEATGKLYFAAHNGLWTTDGTTEGTLLVEQGTADVLANANGALHFFRGLSGGLQLRKLAAGAATPVDVPRSGPGVGSSNPTTPILYKGALYFAADDGVTGQELRRRNSNGTIELIADITPASANNGATIRNLTSANGLLYFNVRKQFSTGLWRSDGTAAGTFYLADVDLNSGGENVASPKLVSVNNMVFFAADSGDHELWKSDGTVAGTVMVKNIYPGTRPSNYYPYYSVPNPSFPNELTNVNGTLYFAATDGTGGRELWKSDGTTVGTVLVKDLRPGVDPYDSYSIPYSSNPSALQNRNGTLHFLANDGSGIRFFQSDGTDDGTTTVSESVPSLVGLGASIDVSGRKFFSGASQGAGDELWVSDGTATGTKLLKDIRPGAVGSRISNLTDADGILYFTADDGVHGNELWRSNGTAGGTVMVRDVNRTMPQGLPGSSIPGELTALNGVLYFLADDGTNGRELWRTNGTAGGATKINALGSGAFGTKATGLTVGNNSLLFAGDSNLGRELLQVRAASPLITVAATSVSYTEGQSPVSIASSAALTDSDTSILLGGRLTISLLNPFPGDEIRIKQNAGGITQAGSSVQGFSIGFGVVAPHSATSSLVIDLNLNATVARVQALIRAIGFRSTSDNPVSRDRNIRFTLTDGESGIVSKLVQVQVVPVNSAPTLNGIAPVSYQRNDSAGVALASNAVVGDPDSRDLGGGELHISITGGELAKNRVFLTGTLFSIDLSGNLLRAGVIIGTVNANAGIGNTPFRVTFNSQAKPSHVQQLLRSLKFSTVNSTSTNNRVVRISLSDGDGPGSHRTVAIISIL